MSRRDSRLFGVDTCVKASCGRRSASPTTSSAPRLRVGALTAAAGRAAQGHAFEARRLLEEAWAIIEAKGNLGRAPVARGRSGRARRASCPSRRVALPRCRRRARSPTRPSCARSSACRRDVVVSKLADRLNHAHAAVRRALAVRLRRDEAARRRRRRLAARRPGRLRADPRRPHAAASPTGPGNRLADTLTNLLADPSIGLLFLIPGVGDSFRVNGRGVITDDAELLAASEVEGPCRSSGSSSRSRRPTRSARRR